MSENTTEVIVGGAVLAVAIGFLVYAGQSTGFAPYQAKTEFPESLHGLLAECQPWYDKLFANAIRAGDNGE